MPQRFSKVFPKGEELKRQLEDIEEDPALTLISRRDLGDSEEVVWEDTEAPDLPEPQGGAGTESSGSGGGAMPGGAGGALGELIASGEGDYNSFNRGVAGDAKGAKINFAAMTLAAIMADQAMPPGDPKRLFAVGKYQVIPGTMRGARDALNLDTSKPFTPRVQEEIFRKFLVGSKRPPVKNFITGKSDNLAAAQLALAQEFASVADPSTGKSFFDKQAGNSSSITAAQSAKALNDERATFARLVAAGKSEAEAWLALSPGLA
jgi:hypothetical protein